ncbi:MAG TPA: DegQ family serine endoprotease [Afifellaceae bacterium]|nr:DegQ family serine endoprotease [Afifellaceae bacterium]
MTPRIALAAALFAAIAAAAPVDTGMAQRVPETRGDIQLTFAPVVKRAAPAVVNVYATERVRTARLPFEDDPFFNFFFERGPFGMPRERLRSSLGSGVIVDADGLVVTNHHVIRDASEVKVALADGREFTADILLRDERTDLAVLKVRDPEMEFPALDFADSDELEVGDLVLAIGNPFGVGQTVTSGIVSAVARTQIGINDMAFFIQTDAAINPGNSGGALIDVQGRVVGINTAIFSRSGGSHGIGFAIPSNMVRVVVAQALTGNSTLERPWLGAAYQRVTPEIAQSLGLERPMGALVVRVDPDSPADRAGLRVGDLILGADMREVSDPRALEYRLTLAGPEGSTRLEVLRRGRKLSLDVALERPPELTADRRTIDGRTPLSGATVATLTPPLASRLDLPRDKRGVVVVEIDPRSPAARFGLKPGDLVLSLQGIAVRSADELKEIAEEPQRMWRLSIDRQGRIHNVVIGG